MWWTLLLACGDDPLVGDWHRAFELTGVRSAQETDGECEPELAEGGVDEPYAFLAVSSGAPAVASLYLCAGPDAEDCPLQPVGNVRIRKWTSTRLEGEAATSGVFGDLCTVSWNGIDATRTEGGAVHLELRAANRQEPLPDPEDCADLAVSITGSSCDSVLVLDGDQL
jgi:hypothetical protein